MAVRFATQHDLRVTASIAFRGFSLSPWNAFYRPFADKYPEDAENSYLKEQQAALNNGKKLFTVVEVASEQDQKAKVVGFAIWNYAPVQKPRSTPIEVLIQSSQDRSVDEFRSDLLDGATEWANKKYLIDHMELDNMAVDPDHFRHGYGSLLCRYGMNIAKEDKIDVGIIAAAMGFKLYEALGFESLVKINLADVRCKKQADVDFWVQRMSVEKLEGSCASSNL